MILGDATGDVSKLLNASEATWDIADDSGIGLGSSHVLSISNSGLFAKTGGTGTSVIEPKFVNRGQVLVTSGTLDFQHAVTGAGTDTVSPDDMLEFHSSVGSAKTPTVFQTVDFTSSAGGVLDLIDPKGFYGEIKDFERENSLTDTVDLKGDWVFSNFSENPTGTLAMLTLASGSTLHAFDFIGNYASSDHHRLGKDDDDNAFVMRATRSACRRVSPKAGSLRFSCAGDRGSRAQASLRAEGEAIHCSRPAGMDCFGPGGPRNECLGRARRWRTR